MAVKKNSVGILSSFEIRSCYVQNSPKVIANFVHFYTTNSKRNLNNDIPNFLFLIKTLLDLKRHKF